MICKEVYVSEVSLSNMFKGIKHFTLKFYIFYFIYRVNTWELFLVFLFLILYNSSISLLLLLLLLLYFLILQFNSSCRVCLNPSFSSTIAS